MKLEEYKRDDINFINGMIRDQDYYLRGHGITPKFLFLGSDYLLILFKEYSPLFSGMHLTYAEGIPRYCGLEIIEVKKDRFVHIAG